MDTNLRKLVINGAELTYLERGEGIPVVFVHGSLGDFRSWGFQIETFSQHFRIIAYSRRRHWPNEWPGDGTDCSAEEHASDLAVFIEALELETPHLVGSSYGALTILTMAANRPVLARSLVLGEPPLMRWLMDTPERRPLVDAFLREAWQPAGAAFRRGNPEDGVRTFIDGVLGKGSYDRLPLPARANMMDNARVMGIELESAPEAYFSTLAREEVRSIQEPVLLLTGELSPKVFHGIADELSPSLPKAERAVVPGASHSMHTGNPEAYNEIVLGFLARH